MSHTAYDRRGGHLPTPVDLPDGGIGWTPHQRFTAKRFARREMRRESRRIVMQAITAFYADLEDAHHEQMMADLEADYYELDTWDDTGEVRAEPYDPAVEDLFFDDGGSLGIFEDYTGPDNPNYMGANYE